MDYINICQVGIFGSHVLNMLVSILKTDQMVRVLR